MHLDNVPTLREQPRGDRMAEGVEAPPARCRRPYTLARAPRAARLSGSSTEPAADRNTSSSCTVPCGQAISECARDWHVALGVAQLERADHEALTATAAHVLTDLHVRALAFQREMATFKDQQLRASQHGRGKQLEHEPPGR